MPLLFTLLFCILPAILCVKRAKKINRNTIFWGVLGLAFSFIAVLVLYLLLEEPKEELHSQNSNVSSKAVEKLYANTKSFVNNLVVNNCANEDDLMKQIDEIVAPFVNKIATNGVLTVNKKCEILALLSEKLQETTPGYYNMVFTLIIEFSYKSLEEVVSSPLYLQDYEMFNRELAQNNVRDFTKYFADIFLASGMLGSPNGKFKLDYSIFDKYNFPKYREA